MGHHVIDAKRSQLQQVNFNIGSLQRFESAENGVAFHREQPHFAFQCKSIRDVATGHQLVIPNNIFQIEWDLLFGFVLNDVWDFFQFNRRWFEELGQAALARHAERDAALLEIVAANEGLECFTHEHFRFGLRLT